jgi:hypothetical protein
VRSAEARAGLPPSPPLPGALQTWLLWRWPFSFLRALRRRYGTRFTIHALARPPLVFLSDLSEAKEVFAASPELLRPGEGGATIMPIAGEQSFMLADGEVHWRGRTMLSPAFSQHAIDEHAETVRELAERTFSQLSFGGGPLEIEPHARDVATFEPVALPPRVVEDPASPAVPVDVIVVRVRDEEANADEVGHSVRQSDGGMQQRRAAGSPLVLDRRADAADPHGAKCGSD